MPSFTIQIKPKGNDVVHGRIVVEDDPSYKPRKTKEGKAAKKAEPREPTHHKVIVHEGLQDTFDVDVEDGQRIVLEVDAKEELVYDKEQSMATIKPKQDVEEPEDKEDAQAKAPFPGVYGQSQNPNAEAKAEAKRPPTSSKDLKQGA